MNYCLECETVLLPDAKKCKCGWICKDNVGTVSKECIKCGSTNVYKAVFNKLEKRIVSWLCLDHTPHIARNWRELMLEAHQKKHAEFGKAPTNDQERRILINKAKAFKPVPKSKDKKLTYDEQEILNNCTSKASIDKFAGLDDAVKEAHAERNT